MDEEQNKRDFAIALVILVALGVAILSVPARAGTGVVLICNQATQTCSLATARISFQVEYEAALPTNCLEAAQQKLAEMPHLMHSDETVRIACKR